jgi:hypothetical protein
MGLLVFANPHAKPFFAKPKFSLCNMIDVALLCSMVSLVVFAVALYSCDVCPSA